MKPFHKLHKLLELLEEYFGLEEEIRECLKEMPNHGKPCDCKIRGQVLALVNVDDFAKTTEVCLKCGGRRKYDG